MEIAIYAAAIYFACCAMLPIAWIPRARFLRRVTWSKRPVWLFKSILPKGNGACAMWAYGFNCVILDQDWIERARIEEISHILRHEAGHLVMGHARTNTLLCATGLWFLLPFFRAQHEYQAEVFAAMTKDERIVST